MQLLVADGDKAARRAVLYRAWGRLGTTQGGVRTESMALSSAKAEFERHFFEKVVLGLGCSCYCALCMVFVVVAVV